MAGHIDAYRVEGDRLVSTVCETRVITKIKNGRSGKMAIDDVRVPAEEEK